MIDALVAWFEALPWFAQVCVLLTLTAIDAYWIWRDSGSPDLLGRIKQQVDGIIRQEDA